MGISIRRCGIVTHLCSEVVVAFLGWSPRDDAGSRNKSEAIREGAIDTPVIGRRTAKCTKRGTVVNPPSLPSAKLVVVIINAPCFRNSYLILLSIALHWR